MFYPQLVYMASKTLKRKKTATKVSSQTPTKTKPVETSVKLSRKKKKKKKKVKNISVQLDKPEIYDFFPNIDTLIKKDERIGWPKKMPSIPKYYHGWFQRNNIDILQRLSSKDHRCVLELGSWLGMSTRFLLEHNPNAVVFAVDLWSNEYFFNDPHYDATGDKEANALLTDNPIYDQFLVNVQDHKYTKSPKSKGLVPMKMSTLDAIPILKEAGVRPDLIYIDASHHYEFVIKDIELCLDAFPGAIIVGDDWNYEGVKQAVVEAAERHHLQIHARRTCWTYAKTKLENIINEEAKCRKIGMTYKVWNREWGVRS
jgi:hypothetical protein